MKVIYTNTIPENRDHNACYRTSFLGVIGEASLVHVEDDFPNADEVREAYSHLGEMTEQTFTEGTLVPVEQFDAVAAKLTESQQAILSAEEQLATVKGEFIAFQNNIEAMKDRIAELEAGKGTPDPLDGPTPGDYENWKVDQIKAYLTDKGIEYKQSASKPELIALIPKE
ncbi:MAG: HeH/LEM domain protein [Acinetobacter sp.]|nr:HeH/LEM domain protein [Acinetobacter sp.]MPS60577.1 HeH/LEM domain protein [Acinetobacter sp.]